MNGRKTRRFAAVHRTCAFARRADSGHPAMRRPPSERTREFRLTYSPDERSERGIKIRPYIMPSPRSRVVQLPELGMPVALAPPHGSWPTSAAWGASFDGDASIEVLESDDVLGIGSGS